MRRSPAAFLVRCAASGNGVRGAAFLLSLSLASSAVAQPLRDRMLLAEDARPQTPEGLAPFAEGLKSDDADLRRQAVRALGRIERADLVGIVAPVLADADPRVRAEAANALAQMATTANVADVYARLIERLASEPDAAAWGAIAASLGRLPYGDPIRFGRTEARLAAVLPASSEPSERPAHYAAPDAMLGAARGLESLVRLSGKIQQPGAPTIERLGRAAVLQGEAGDDRFPRIRRFAWLTLTALGRIDSSRIEAGLADADEEVRRLAVAALGTDIVIESRAEALKKGLADASPRVRYEALRAWGRHLSATSCEPMRVALDDGSPHVVLLAIDLLGACKEGWVAGTLQTIADGLTAEPRAWHRPAHAIVALARVQPAQAQALLPRYVAHGTWQVRMYAARAAAALGATETLEALGRDGHDNVREAALNGLVGLKRPEAVTAALDALATRQDPQLLLTAARVLGVQPSLVSPEERPRAQRTLGSALERLSSTRRETSRDPRLAMLDSIRELGPPSPESSAEIMKVLRERLSDFDPRVAQKAADVIGAWTKQTQQYSPQPLPEPKLDLSRVPAGRDIRLVVTMSGGRRIVLRLLTDEAPLSALRLLTLAERGYYNGLTFHRVVPNFVIQGGSPGANEYAGDGAFMRDEVGLISHRRGTVGISTRGRDTGDAQIFVNLVDLPRLDHTYTVVAEVVEGMDVVDGILEGDVIEKVEVEGESSPPGR